MDTNASASCLRSATTTTLPELVLTPADIPGAVLEQPFQSHTIPALKRWLETRGFTVPGSWKKAQIVTKIEKIILDGQSENVIDVDGSYLYAKYQRLSALGEQIAPLPPPTPPPSGWKTVTDENHQILSAKIPPVTAGLVYTYMAGNVGRDSSEQGAFRALKRGYVHYASGRLEKIEINTNHPKYCHVRARIRASMKDVVYSVYLLLKRDGPSTSITQATCQCAAGKSASCTHISALLHALTALSPSCFRPIDGDTSDEDEECVPVTSQLCKWNVPKKRKTSLLPMSKIVFEKHDYAKISKQKIKLLEDFDPRPSHLRGKAKEYLPELLDKVRGQQLCVSLLFDERYQQPALSNVIEPEKCSLPDHVALKETITAFKDSLSLSEEKICHIEQNTRDQRLSPLWHSSRRYRITASNFGRILSRKDTTPPDSLVLRLLQPKYFSTPAIRYGIENEPIATAEYLSYQHKNGHQDLAVSSSGFMISYTYSYLGASPDGAVYDPSNSEQPFGFLEIKCPYQARDLTPLEACSLPAFCCQIDPTKNLRLKKNHNYYSQVQGQMSIGGRKWCDFVIYTKKGISVERIPFDNDFWENLLLPKLTSFYDNILAPEIVSPAHALGQPVRDLSKLP